MNLNKLTSELSRKGREINLIYLERYVNESGENFQEFSNISIKYSPQLGDEVFLLPYFFVDDISSRVIIKEPSTEIKSKVIKQDRALFFAHPAIYHVKGSNSIPVSPTASTRTVLTRGFRKNFFIKTDLDILHYRFNRKLKGDSVRFCIEVNEILKNYCNKNISIDFAILPESLGVINGIKGHDSGILFREFVPYPYSQEKRMLIPYFSLYSRDVNSPAFAPLLVQLIEHNKPKDKLNFFLNKFISPIIQTWLDVLYKTGLLLEMHGQNILIEINSRGKLKRIVYRDFQSVYFDPNIRKSINQPLLIKHCLEASNIKLHYSYIYDWMIGKFLFQRLINTFLKHYPIYDLISISLQIKSIFEKFSKENTNDLFPVTMIAFPFEKDFKGIVYRDSGNLPLFR